MFVGQNSREVLTLGHSKQNSREVLTLGYSKQKSREVLTLGYSTQNSGEVLTLGYSNKPAQTSGRLSRQRITIRGCKEFKTWRVFFRSALSKNR